MLKNKKLLIVVLINVLIFSITNVLFNIKYEQVDDFIIYNLYSGLDGTYNMHGIYIHPLICFILSIFFKIIPSINWHTMFLLISQFMCFTIIGYIIIKKQNNGISILLYTLFASVFYPTLLMLIQYTSVAALLILTSVFMLMNIIEQKENKNIKYKILMFLLFLIGIMTRLQSLIIMLPFLGLYLIVNIVKFMKKEKDKENVTILIKYYCIYFIIVVVTYISSSIIYNSNIVYKEYMEFNDARATLHDIIYVDYEENKEIFDEVGWSKNDHYMFYTFNFGDENIYSKENIEKILNYKIQKDGKYNFNISMNKIESDFVSETMNTYTYISILFVAMFIINLLVNKEKSIFNILIFVITVGLHILFLIIGRSMLRVVIPEYIMRNCTINI